MSVLEGMLVGNVTDTADVLAQAESDSKETERLSLPSQMPSELATRRKKNTDPFASAQAELFDMLQDTHRHWFERMQSNAELASELASTLTNCRSVPDVVAACQEWTSRGFEMMADDAKHVLAHYRKVMQTGARFLTDGLLLSGKDGATTEANGREQDGIGR